MRPLKRARMRGVAQDLRTSASRTRESSSLLAGACLPFYYERDGRVDCYLFSIAGLHSGRGGGTMFARNVHLG